MFELGQTKKGRATRPCPYCIRLRSAYVFPPESRQTRDTRGEKQESRRQGGDQMDIIDESRCIAAGPSRACKTKCMLTRRYGSEIDCLQSPARQRCSREKADLGSVEGDCYLLRAITIACPQLHVKIDAEVRR